MRVPLVADGVRAVTERLTGSSSSSSALKMNAPTTANARPSATPHGHDALAATKRALALRVLFDADGRAGSLLARGRARTAEIRAAAARRAADMRRAPPYRAAGYLLAVFALYLIHRRRNRDRRALLREHRERAAEVQAALDHASSYEEFIGLAHRMEALEEEHAGRLRALAHGKPPAPAAGPGTTKAARTSSRSNKDDDTDDDDDAASSVWSVGQAVGDGTRSYDRELIEEQLRLLRAQRASGNVEEMMFSLRADILRNLGNMTDIGRKLHEPLWGVPRAVRDYIDETRAQLRAIAQDNDVPIQEKLAFLQETRHCFGRTALLLSGGGTLGTFHVGVARALHSRGLLPRVLAGSSVGSIVAAIIASRTPEELDEFFSEKHFWDLLPDMTFFSGRDFFSSIQHLMRTGALHDIDFFQRCLRALLGDLTFQEAYDRSGGRILCVCVCATRAGRSRAFFNYLTSPHLVVWSAVAASCAFPSLFPPQPLLAKSRNGAFVPWQPEGKLGARRWRDGSLENDLPMQGLSELFNVNYFIVSQTNPHIVPILRLKRWFASKNRIFAMIAQFLESEWRHRCTQVLDLVPWVDTFDFAKLFGQQWEGNVTVVMEYSWKQFKNIATNPTREFLFETATMGEREMWPKLATIESNCGIEMQLDECVRALREKLSQRQGYMNLKQRGRVPSWNTINYCGRDSYLHMPQTGGSIASTITVNDNGSDAGLLHQVSSVKSSFAAAAAANIAGHSGHLSGHSTHGDSAGSMSVSMSRESSAGSLSDFMHVVADQMEAQDRAATNRESGSPRRSVVPAAAATIDKVIVGGAASLLRKTFGAMGAKPTKHGVNGSHGSQRSLGSPGRGGTPPRSPSHSGRR